MTTMMTNSIREKEKGALKKHEASMRLAFTRQYLSFCFNVCVSCYEVSNSDVTFSLYQKEIIDESTRKE